MQERAAFVREIETWFPVEGEVWRCVTVSAAGREEAEVAVSGRARGAASLVRRVAATLRPEIASVGAEQVMVVLPHFQGRRMTSVVALHCHNSAGRRGGIEVWDPTASGDLVRSDGFYGGLNDFARSSRWTRFSRGTGLPGITWLRQKPHIMDDVRFSPLFLRAVLAREHALALGLGIPIFRDDTLQHVLVLLTALGCPAARALEVWVPDSHERLWLDHAVHDAGLETVGRSSRTTCLVRGEGVAGRAATTREPQVWTSSSEAHDPTDFEAARAGLTFGLALPIVQGDATSAVLVLRS